MRRSRLYLATRSDRDGAPVLIWPVPIATTRSAMVVSSVSPERCETTADQPRAARERDRFDRLGQRADLVELDEDGVRRVLLDRPGDPLGVRDQQVVADELDGRPQPLGQVPPALPVVLGEAVLERDDRVARGPIGPQVDQLTGIERPALARQHVARRRAVDAGALLDELARRRDRARSRCRCPAGSRPARSPAG